MSPNKDKGVLVETEQCLLQRQGSISRDRTVFPDRDKGVLVETAQCLLTETREY